MISRSLKLNRDFRLDCARGLTVFAMVGYHFCFDLIHFGYGSFEGLARDMNHHLGWLTLRSLIVGSFILISGLSLGYRKTCPPSSYRKSQCLLGLSALMVSIGSYFVFPDTWIDFGVLHFFFITRLLVPLFLRYTPRTLSILAAILALISCAQHPFFDAIPWRWIGLTTHKPLTEDYVPLLPWISVFIIGLAASSFIKPHIQPHPPQYALIKTTCWIGQHSLAIYLIHQPLLWGAFSLLSSHTST